MGSSPKGLMCGFAEADRLYRESLIDQDLSFQRALVAAVAQGLEKAPKIPSLEDMYYVILAD